MVDGSEVVIGEGFAYIDAWKCKTPVTVLEITNFGGRVYIYCQEGDRTVTLTPTNICKR